MKIPDGVVTKSSSPDGTMIHLSSTTPSSKRPGVKHKADGFLTVTCSCEGFEHYRKCKHVRLLLSDLAAAISDAFFKDAV